MSDPRYTDPLKDPRGPESRDPADPASPRRLDLEDDSGRGTMWAWIVAVIAVIVVGMVLYDYNRSPASTAGNVPTSSPPVTTGAAPPPAPKVGQPNPAPAPGAPATPAPSNTPR